MYIFFNYEKLPPPDLMFINYCLTVFNIHIYIRSQKS